MNERISAGTRAGLARAVEDGATLGRPRAVLDLAGLEALRAQGLSIRAIAGITGLSSMVVSRAVGNGRKANPGGRRRNS